MKQERRLEDMIAELHEAVSELPPPAPVNKTTQELFINLSVATNALGVAFAEKLSVALEPLAKRTSYNLGVTWIDNRSRWQKIKDKVMRR